MVHRITLYRPPIYLPVRYNSITHTHTHCILYCTHTRGHVFLFFFRAPFFPLHYHRYIILLLLLSSCRVRTAAMVFTLASPARSFFPITAWLSDGCCGYTHTHTHTKRPSSSASDCAVGIFVRARARVCARVIYVRQSHGPSLIVFIYHTVQSR